MIRTIVLWGICASLLAACSSSPSIPDAQLKAPLTMDAGARVRPVKYGMLVMEVPRGTVVGEEMGHLACYYTDKIKMGRGLVSVDSQEIAFDFYNTLKGAGIATAGDPRQVYAGNESAAELEVSGVVDKLWLNVCHPNEDYRRVKGGAAIHVTWKIYDPILGKTIYTTSTEGAYKNPNTGEANEPGFVLGALDIAMANLVADQGFHDAVLSDPMRDLAAKPGYGALEMTAPPPEQSLTNARAATVTIFSSIGSGSGVIVSPDGYALTAYHVVQEGKVVRVRLSTHRDVMGDVVRIDPVRDVALIKLAEDHLPAVAVRTGTEPEVGEPVFAIGTPLDERNDNTTTQGIISTYRTKAGLKFIQSDVSVQHGNSGGPLVDQSGLLIGLCDQGETSSADRSEGLNFFVPIGETMDRLKLRYPAAADSGHMQ